MLMSLVLTNLANISFNSCSDTNWPKFATKSVEQGGLLTPKPGCEDDDPTGEAKAGLGRKCGKDAACTEVRAVGCGKDIGGCKQNHISTLCSKSRYSRPNSRLSDSHDKETRITQNKYTTLNKNPDKLGQITLQKNTSYRLRQKLISDLI